MRGRVGITLGTVGLLVVGLSLTRGAREDEPAATSHEIYKEQAELAREALEVLKSEVVHGVKTPGARVMATWSRRLVEAERKTGDAKAYRQALQDHLALMTENVEFAEGEFKAGQVMITEVLDAKYALNEARLWIAREDQTKTPQQK